MPTVDTNTAALLRRDNEPEGDTTGAHQRLPVALPSPLAYLGTSVIADRHVLVQQPIRDIFLLSRHSGTAT